MTNNTKEEALTTMDKRVQAWLSAKQMIVDQEFDTSDMLMLAKAISPQNPLNKCFIGFDSVTMEMTQEERLVPSFTLELYLPTKESAKMLSLCMNGYSLNLPFKATIGFDKAGDGLPGYTLRIKSQGEITPRGVSGMAHAINLEQYAKYAIFRSMSNFLARSAIYGFDMTQTPERTVFATRLPPGALADKEIRDRIILAEKVFIPANKEIDSIISSGLTTIDLLDLKNEFNRSIHKTPTEFLQYVTGPDVAVKNVLGKNEKPADPAGTRRKFG